VRAERLVSILLLLQVHGRLTGRALAERLEVSERTVLRDMEALASAGVPVVSERGRSGGWALVEGYRTKLTGLTTEEIRTLFLAHPPQLLKALGLGRAAEAAWLKLRAALPPSGRHQIERARQAILIDPGGWREAESAACLPVLLDALWHERRVRFFYESGVGEVGERIVDALGLVARGSVWYLVAAKGEQPRTYRVSRMRDAALEAEPSHLPAGFDLAAYWHRSAAEFQGRLPRYHLTALVEPGVLRWVRYRALRIEEEIPAGRRVRITLRFDVEDEALQFALAFGADVEVVEPVALKRRALEAARATVERYAAASKTGSPNRP
jgi:predicted DNA-binding transcriptional regulator YafY